MTVVRHTLVTGSFVENGYVLHKQGARDCVVIDPGAEPERWVAFLDDNDLHVAAILGTHGHLDHVGAVAALQARDDAPYLVHAEEAVMIEHLPTQFRMFRFPAFDVPRITGHVTDGQRLEPAGFPIQVIATPGHTPGGASYYVADLATVFTGDSLFAGTIGRTDLPGGDHGRLLRSLRRLVEMLPDETIVAAGHGPDSTIGQEKTGNPFLG